ncbi:hypothetical protein GCM10010975_23420 [Comamonas phosphati]|nr:hypothetical protein GCM10010975_23420 [Comamonas phosphati]
MQIRQAQLPDAPGIAALLQGIGWFKAYENRTPEQNAEAVRALLAGAEAAPERSLLLDAATEAARQRGCSRIWLVNNRERPSYARGFYPQQGWTEQAEMARFVLPLNT